MRTAFINTLTKLAKKDKRIYLLTGDLGFSVFEDFSKKFPKRFINCGVAEQNMMGVAAGLALSGKKPYVYSIVPFVTLRCLEQIRNDICYQDLDVKIVGIGGGLSYGTLGATHHAIEDLGILRSLPNMMVFSPGDQIETEKLILESYKIKKPAYIRLVKGGKGSLYKSEPNIKIGKPSVLRKGLEKIIISTGVQTSTCLDIIDELNKSGQRLGLINIHTLKPIDKEFLIKEVKKTKKIITVEEHAPVGGLGSAVAEILIEYGWRGNFKKISLPDNYLKEVGSSEYLRKKHSLDREHLREIILS